MTCHVTLPEQTRLVTLLLTRHGDHSRPGNRLIPQWTSTEPEHKIGQAGYKRGLPSWGVLRLGWAVPVRQDGDPDFGRGFEKV